MLLREPSEQTSQEDSSSSSLLFFNEVLEKIHSSDNNKEMTFVVDALKKIWNEKESLVNENKRLKNEIVSLQSQTKELEEKTKESEMAAEMVRDLWDEEKERCQELQEDVALLTWLLKEATANGGKQGKANNNSKPTTTTNKTKKKKKKQRSTSPKSNISQQQQEEEEEEEKKEEVEKPISDKTNTTTNDNVPLPKPTGRITIEKSKSFDPTDRNKKVNKKSILKIKKLANKVGM